MYCHNCGHEQSDQHKFCAKCGAELNFASQPRSPKSDYNHAKPGVGKRSGKVFVVIIVTLFAIFGLMIALASFGSDSADKPTSVEADATQAKNHVNSSEVEVAETTDPIPDNGWYTENGKRYYFSDGDMYVDLHEIDGNYYYFYEDGTLAVSADVEYEGFTFKTDRDGIPTRVIFSELGGEWSEESYHFGNSGSSSILELTVPLEDCTSMSFYLEANGKYGAKVNGKWMIYIRSNGKWEFLQEISYTEPSGTFDIEIDEPISFDAITAHPTVQGNATYSSFFYLQNVDCPFYVLQKLF